MKNRHLRTIIIWGSFVLVCLMVVQVYWLTRAFNVAEKQFDHSVQMALRKVADSVSSSPEIKKLSSNFFYVDTHSELDNARLDSLLKTEFKLHDLTIAYELGIYKAWDDTLVYGNYIKASKPGKSGLDHVGNADTEEKNFAVFFPKRKSYVASQLGIWIFSTFILLLMVGFFAYTIASLLRERRFSDLKNDFINNMTHEFKTPVTNINIAAEILRQKFAHQEGSDVYLNILLRENEKLRLKIERVLLGSTIEYNQRPTVTCINIHELIRDCAEAFSMKIKERNGTINLQLDPTIRFIPGDKELLSQAISNVIDNAEKYSVNKPLISVRTFNTGKNIEIEITDEGIGIPDKEKSRVFEKFFRVSTGNVHRVKGFGLGLSFVKSAVTIHRGYVQLVSELNAGTRIKITLPAA